MSQKYGFIYLWYDRKHKRYYIGSHWGTINDNYVCGSTWMRDAKRRRPQDFKRRIIDYLYTNRKELYQLEEKWLSLIKENELGKRYYNLMRFAGGTSKEGAKRSWTSKRKKAHSQKLKEKWKTGTYRDPKAHRQTVINKYSQEEYRNKMREICKTREYVYSEESKKKMSKKAKERSKTKEHLDQFYQNMAKVDRKKVALRGSNHQFFGMKWFNNGKETGRFFLGQEPAGWRLGRLIFHY